jgi:hypothetical protein
MLSFKFQAFSFDHMPMVLNFEQDVMSYSFFYEEFTQSDKSKHLDDGEQSGSSFQLQFYVLCGAIIIASIASIFFLFNILKNKEQKF